MFRCMEKAWYRYACNAPDKKDEAANAAGLFPFPSVGWADEEFFLTFLVSAVLDNGVPRSLSLKTQHDAGCFVERALEKMMTCQHVVISS